MNAVRGGLQPAGGLKAAATLQWIVATTIAVVLANLAVEILFFAVMGCALLVVLPFVGGVIGGFPVGVSQWLVLRRFPGSTAWIVATTVGFALAWTIGAILLAAMLAISGDGADWMTFLAFALPTPIIGLAQARVMRRWTARTSVWIVASTIAWTAFVAIHIFAPRSLGAVDVVAAALVSRIAGYAITSSVGATLLGGVAAGTISGAAASAILRSGHPATSELERS